MPYIDTKDRPQFSSILNQLPEITKKGELEFCVYYLCLKYMLHKKWSYEELHNASYAAIHAGREFERKNLDKREDEAIAKNGDIFLDDAADWEVSK